MSKVIVQPLGIHRRLEFIIDHNKGIDHNLRKEYLMATYSIKKEIVDIITYYDFEAMLKTYSVDEAIEIILIYENSKELKKKKNERLLSTLIRMFRG